MIQSDESTISYAGNNSTSIPYPVPYYFLEAGDLLVSVKNLAGTEAIQILNADYTVTGAGNLNGGNIIMTWAVPITSTVTISRQIELTQLMSYEEADLFPAKSHERALDKLTMGLQQVLRRAEGGPPPSPPASVQLALPRGHITGLKVSNAADVNNDITIAPGKCRDSTDSVDIILNGAITKQTDALWAVGNNTGGRDTGVVTNGGWHIFLIYRNDTGVVDALLSRSPTAPTMPTGYTHRRRILSVPYYSGLYKIRHDAPYVWLNPSIVDYNSTGGPASNLLTCLPTGIKFAIFGQAKVFLSSGPSYLFLWDPDMTGTGTNIEIARANAANYTATGYFQTMTDVNGNIKASSTVGSTITVETWAYMDYRGIYD